MSLVVPNGLRDIVSTFGQLTPRDGNKTFALKYIQTFNLPYPMDFGNLILKRASAHKLLVPLFIDIFSEIKSRNLTQIVNDYGGIYNYRTIRGINSNPSTHCWGISIDLEPIDFPLGSKKRLDSRIVEIFTRRGFVYGGDFKGRKDPMHFQFAKNY